MWHHPGVCCKYGFKWAVVCWDSDRFALIKLNWSYHRKKGTRRIFLFFFFFYCEFISEIGIKCAVQEECANLTLQSVPKWRMHFGFFPPLADIDVGLHFDLPNLVREVCKLAWLISAFCCLVLSLNCQSIINVRHVLAFSDRAEAVSSCVRVPRA